MQTSSSTRAGLPSYVPPGYKLRQTIEGPAAMGFGLDPNQVGHFYVHGYTDEEIHTPLSVFMGPPGAPPLAATEHRPGQPVDIGVPNVTALYHDGMWVPGPGEDQQNVGPGVLHWERAVAHSLTVHAPDGVYAIRGGKRIGAGIDELVKVAKSLFGAGAGE